MQVLVVYEIFQAEILYDEELSRTQKTSKKEITKKMCKPDMITDMINILYYVNY